MQAEQTEGEVWGRRGPAGRDCVAPEVNRNRNIGERGANMERPLFQAHLRHMTWHQDKARRPAGPLAPARRVLQPSSEARTRGHVHTMSLLEHDPSLLQHALGLSQSNAPFDCPSRLSQSIDSFGRPVSQVRRPACLLHHSWVYIVRWGAIV